MDRTRLGPLLAVVAALGLLIALYLTSLKLSGQVPPCVVGGGCETVDSSVYSVVLGIPLAAFGAAYSAVVLAGALAWWRGGDRRLLVGLYLLGLVATIIEAYLVYLELFVLHAVCSWCVAFGATVVLGWLLVLPGLRHREATAPA
jgi:uncharacterized membrane protein